MLKITEIQENILDYEHLFDKHRKLKKKKHHKTKTEQKTRKVKQKIPQTKKTTEN